MARFLKSRLKAQGAAPGSFIFMGKQKMDAPRIRLMQFDRETVVENEFKKMSDATRQIDPQKMNWLNIDGLHDIEPIKAIGTHFNISALALENILNTGQRAKLFEDKNSLAIILKAVYFNTQTNKISIEQISFILGENLIISFQEEVGDYFEPVRDRIRSGLGRIRTLSSDYLLYSLMDCIVDHNLIINEQIGDKIEQLELELYNPTPELSRQIFYYKTEVSYFRKTVRPLKELMTRILRTNSELIHKDNIVYFQELNDLVEHTIETIETYYQMIGDQLSIYNTNLSNRANDVMKVLTIFASIFIPLTFIAGIYGTNFDHVPELHFKYGYFGMWGVMILVAGIMLKYFKKNNWF